MADLTRFNPENCDIRTQLMFEEWATVPMFRIMTLVLARKGKGIFSSRGIAGMINIPKSTVHEALKTLVARDYLNKEGDRYTLNVGMYIAEPEVSSPPDTVQPTGQERPAGRTDVSSPPDASVQPTGPNNDKQIIKNNNDKRITDFFAPDVQEDIGTGRRPLRKYPEIWITPQDLTETLEALAEAGIPQSNFKDVFRKVRTFARDQAGDTKNFKRVRCHAALTGWAKKEVVAELNEAAKLKRNSQPSFNGHELPRPQPKAFEPPPVIQVTEEQRQANLAKLRAIIPQAKVIA